ncbi:MAG TPA: hypothetical protein VFO39_01735 [Candidatus Sulfotelmatobacter sp.]|nr:hypothetical protein [Candidatus Sulfotelmatobacter sp.]
MTDDRKSGIALIAGSLGLILTMVMHPLPVSSLTAEQVMHLMVLSGVAHTIAMASALLLFLGACGLTRSIAAPDRIAFSAVAIFGFACVAVLIATAVSGFIIPEIMKHMVRDAAENQHQWQIVITSIFQINQTFSRIYSVATGLAIILWSVSGLRNGGFGRGAAIYGCVASALVIATVGSGLLRLDVHGMAAVVLAQAVWFILIGSRLRSGPVTTATR